MHACCQTNFLHVSFQPKYISQVSLCPKRNSVSVHLTNFLPFRYFVPVLAGGALCHPLPGRLSLNDITCPMYWGLLWHLHPRVNDKDWDSLDRIASALPVCFQFGLPLYCELWYPEGRLCGGSFCSWCPQLSPGACLLPRSWSLPGHSSPVSVIAIMSHSPFPQPGVRTRGMRARTKTWMTHLSPASLFCLLVWLGFQILTEVCACPDPWMLCPVSCLCMFDKIFQTQTLGF